MGKAATSALFCEIRAERGRVEFQPQGARVRVQWRLMRVRPPRHSKGCDGQGLHTLRGITKANQVPTKLLMSTLTYQQYHMNNSCVLADECAHRGHLTSSQPLNILT